MERIYSAFFTSDRRQAAELTAEALEKHNESQPKSDVPPLVVAVETDAPSPAAAPSDDGDHQNQHQQLQTALETRRSELKLLLADHAAIKRDILSAVKAAARAFVFAYGTKAFTAVLLASRKWSSIEYGYADAVRLLLRADTIRFGAFFGSLVGIFRLTEIAARIGRGRKDQLNLAIAGGVSGLAMLVDSPSRRSTISLYIFVRMLDVVGRHLTSVGKLPTVKYSSESLFALSNVAIMYAFVADPTLLSKGYYQWILHMGGVTHNGLEYTVRHQIRGELDAVGKLVAFRTCQPHYHMGSCVTHAIKEWAAGFTRALQIYLPVHCLPALIFRFKQLQQAPVTATTKVSYAVLRSSSFLTSYQTLVQLVICTIRNMIQRDVPAESWIAGLSTGLTLFFEDPKRRFELMLYCVPHAMEIVWKVLKRRGLVRYVKHSEVALFCVSMAMIMSSPPQYFKPTYLRILRFVFGRHVI